MIPLLISYHLLVFHFVPETNLITLHIFTHLILTEKVMSYIIIPILETRKLEKHRFRNLSQIIEEGSKTPEFKSSLPDPKISALYHYGPLIFLHKLQQISAS